MVVWHGSGISWTIWKQSAPCYRQITTPTSRRRNFNNKVKIVSLLCCAHRRRQGGTGVDRGGQPPSNAPSKKNFFVKIEGLSSFRWSVLKSSDISTRLRLTRLTGVYVWLWASPAADPQHLCLAPGLPPAKSGCARYDNPTGRGYFCQMFNMYTCIDCLIEIRKFCSKNRVHKGFNFEAKML